MKEIENKEQQIDNPTIKETAEADKESESKKTQFGNSLDSFSSTGSAKRQEGNIAQSENKESPEHKADAEKNVETKASSDTPEERKENLGAQLDKLSTDGSEKDDAYINAMNNMSDYLNKHNYGREDYAEYSKDPEWQKLNAELQKSLGMEVTTYPAEEKVLSKEEALNNMSDYLNKHNYGREDYAEYSKDPEWQKLNTDLQKSLGMEVTTYEPETDAESITEVPSVEDISKWIGEINPSYDPYDPDCPYNVNCGSCALAVEKRLNGDETAVASDVNIPSIEEMNAVTGMEQTKMTPEEIKEYLISEGPGSHAIVGIDRSEGAGHWFNAYYDGEKVVAIDGQTGEISDWPPDYGNVTNWDVSVRKEEKE